MVMAAPIRTRMWQRPMTTDTQVLTLVQWLSPAYPVGAFAYSHGLEAAVQTGAVRDADDLQDWLGDVLASGSGRNDCILLRVAYSCADVQALEAVNETGLAFAASAERQLESAMQGAAFGQTTGAIWGGEGPALIYPVAVGAAAARAGIDVTLTAAIYAQAMAGNLVGAAQRLMPLGQTAAQRILAALTPLCERVARDTDGATLDDLHSSAFASDIAAMRHETQQPRIFRT